MRPLSSYLRYWFRHRSRMFERLSECRLRNGRALALLIFILGCVSCAQGEEPRSGVPVPLPSLDSPASEIWSGIDSPPNLDLIGASQRLRGVAPSTTPAGLPAVSPQIGSSEEFWIIEIEPVRRFSVNAVLKDITPHALWYSDSSIQVSDEAIRASAQEFESTIYPLLTSTLGFQDKDVPMLTILNSSFRGASGYFSSRDMYPTSVYPFSNQRPMLYIHAGALRPGTRGYNSVVSHEFQHYLHWLADPNEESWINEGMSVWTEELSGFKPGIDRALSQNADIQLTFWDADPSSSTPHYASAYLFMRYLAQRYGGSRVMGTLMKESADSIDGINDFLAKLGHSDRFTNVFAQWVAANFLDSKPGTSGHYDDSPVKVRATATVRSGESLSSKVHQFGARYYEIGNIRPETIIRFAGEPANKLIPAQPKSGSFQWWSNRGDFIDSTMTREFDLSGVSSATLVFSLWYDTEDKWDYGYIEASPDGGHTWKIMQGSHITVDNPVGNAFGPGYTGISGGGNASAWLDERVDLTSYAGGKVLVRFEYITDEAVNLNGVAVDDIRVPEIGYSTDAEHGDDGWIRDGFVRTDNFVPQEYLVQAIVFYQGGEVRVVPVQLDRMKVGSLGVNSLGSGVERVVVAVSGAAPITTETAPFTLSVE
ncbi:MAG: hypothetical protein EXR50_03605 [Dehalococcoidia bacterium]|nr:hypothetical protein [Dehalococcoidia bacterium]